jgi:hypothetical protein
MADKLYRSDGTELKVSTAPDEGSIEVGDIVFTPIYTGS